MKAILGLLVVLVICFVALGFYQGWFHLWTNNTGPTPSATVGVDEKKMLEDKKKFEKKVEDIGDKSKSNAAAPADKAVDPQPRP